MRGYETLTVALGLLAAVSCGGKDDTAPDVIPTQKQPIVLQGPLPPPTALSCSAGTQLTYENFGEGFMLNYCTTCHAQNLTGKARNGAPDGQDFDTAGDVTVWRAAILADLAASPPKMPPSNNVPAEDLTLAVAWLNCGAPSAGGPPRIQGAQGIR